MRVYSSDDVGAPQLPNVDAGNYLFGPILKAVLVDGYGAQPGAGWTCPFSNATGMYVFKQGGGNQRYFQVDDSQTAMVSSMRYILVRGYETMSDIATGTGPFPSFTNSLTGMLMRYRINVHSGSYLPRWEIYADATTCLIFTDSLGDPAGVLGYRSAMYFGQFDSLIPGDKYNDMVMGGATTSTPGANFNYTNLTQMYVTRDQRGTGGSVVAAAGYGAPWYMSGSAPSSGSVPLPDPITGTMLMVKIPVVTVVGVIANVLTRGYFKWLWDTPHPATTLNVDNTFSGLGANASRSFKIKCGYQTTAHRLIVETSDTWVA